MARWCGLTAVASSRFLHPMAAASSDAALRWEHFIGLGMVERAYVLGESDSRELM